MSERPRRIKNDKSRKKTDTVSFPSQPSLSEDSSHKKNFSSSKRSSSKEPDKKHKLDRDGAKKPNGHQSDSKTKDSTSKASDKEIIKKASYTTTSLSEKEKFKGSKEGKPKTIKNIQTPPEPAQEYEDDFEDYESDFEEDVEDEVEKAKEGINFFSGHEDKRVGESLLLQRLATAHANRSESGDSQFTRQINFSTSNQTPQRAMSAQRKFSFVQSPAKAYDGDVDSLVTWEETEIKPNRLSDEQKQLAKLKSSKFYEYFQQLSGANAQLVQASTQTNEDNLPMGCQTEVPDTSNAATQNPTHFASSFPTTENMDATKENYFFDKDANFTISSQSSSYQTKAQLQRLSKFVGIVGELFVHLLDAERPKELLQLHMQHNSNIMLSSRYTIFSAETIVKDECKTNCITRNASRVHTILYAIYIPSSPNPMLNKKSLIMEFDMEQPISPVRIFHCENEVTCCCYSSDGNTAVFAGLKDGSFVAWDLRESETLHSSKRLALNQNAGSGGEIVLRTPAYDSSYVVLKKDRFQRMESPTVAVRSSSSSQHTNSSLSQQVVTVNEAGVLTIWAMLDGYSTNKQFEQDLGMAPEAKLKLTRISTVDWFSTAPPSGLLKDFGAPTVSCVEPIPNDHLQFLVGTTKGTILKMNKIKGKTAGSRIRVFSTDKNLLTEVTCIRFSPFDPKVFAAGSYFSNIFIFHLSYGQPQRVLSTTNISLNISESYRGLPVTSLEWSHSASHVLYTIHNGEQLLIWDIESEDGAKATLLDTINFVKEYGSKISSTAMWRDSEQDKRSSNSFMVSNFRHLLWSTAK